VAGEWAVGKVRAEAVFTRPFLGMTSLVSVQAVHLHRAAGETGAAAWKIANFEELPDAAAPAVPRTGPAPPTGAAGEGGAGPDATPFPVSRLAPARADHARTTRLRLRLARRDGSSFPAVPSTPSQRVLDAVTDSTPPVRDDAH